MPKVAIKRAQCELVHKLHNSEYRMRLGLKNKLLLFYYEFTEKIIIFATYKYIGKNCNYSSHNIFNNNTMKKILLLALCLVSALFATAQIEDYTLPDGKVIKVDRSVFPDFKYDETPKPQPAEYVARRKARAKQGKIKLPPYVYNGESKYFPPIFNQDGGSCGSAQSIGYMFTHEMCCYRDLDASIAENQYPTHFTWLLAYQNTTSEGITRALGVPNVPTYGGRTYSRLFGAQTHDDPDYGWMQGYDKWYSAMWNKTAQGITFAPTNTPEGQRELKEWLYNHSGDETMQGGGIAGIGVASGGNWGSIPTTDANKAAGVNGKKYVKSWGTTYDHAVTICGYDDRIEFDLDGDGNIGEVAENEVGAWIIANSWGSGWENKGFIYCPYKYCYAVGKNSLTWIPTAHTIRKDYRPLRTIKLLMDYTHRSEISLSAGISEDLNATKPDVTIGFEHFLNHGNTLRADPAPEVPMLGRWTDGMHHEPMEFGYDLTDMTAMVDRTKPLKYFFIVKTKEGSIGSGHIYKASIINYEIENEGVEIPFDAENVEIVNTNNETIISVIVPGEQFYPATNLAVNDGKLSWDAPIASSLTLTGYHVYGGETVIAKIPAGETEYTIGNGVEGPFTVKAVYKAGNYELESTPTNKVVLEFPTAGANKTASFFRGGLTIPNAIPRTLNQATIEYCIRSTNNMNYSHQIGTGWGKFLCHNNSDGTLSVGWDNDSNNRLNISKVFASTTKWYHVAIVIDGNVLTAYINGIKRGSITSPNNSGFPGIGDLEFGRTGENQAWDGGLDEIRIWDRALDKDEVRQNMRISVAKPGLQPGLLVYIPMETITVNGKILLRDWVGGKHAIPHSIGTWDVIEEEGIFSTKPRTPSLAISEKDTTHLAGLPFSLTAIASFNATDWIWSAPGAKVPEVRGATPTFTYTKAGTYNVTCTTLFATGDTITASKEVKVIDGKAPVAAFEILDDTLPAGDRFSFVNRSEGDACTYHWSMPGAEVEEFGATNATALFTSIGTFPVTLTATNTFGSSSVTHNVTVMASTPEARFDISHTAIMLGDTIKLIDDSRYSPASWQWELNNGSRNFQIDEQSPFIEPAAPGIYDISLTVENELGNDTYVRNRYLVVSNDDPGTCLNFNGHERLQLPCPFTEEQTAITLDWWMRPQEYHGCFYLSSTQGDFLTSVDSKGAININLGGKKAASDNNFVICNEWHHYAIVYNEGTLQFYRDARLVYTVSGKLPATFPALGTITMGDEYSSLRGQIDEVRLWGSALTTEKILAHSNNPISNVHDAQAEDLLLLYYDFNQSGGNVIDRTGGGCNAERIGFGPDGDAWNSSLGVFTLDNMAQLHGDVSADFLTNYKHPFIKGSGTVNPNNRSRFLRLAMNNAKSAWKNANAITKGQIITGAHIDTNHQSDITFETYWNGFATPLLDYRLWQAVKLPAGNYKFSVTFGDGSDAQTSRLVVCQGDTMISDADCESKAIAWSKLTEGTLSFSLDEETEVSLGIIVNLTGQASFNIHAFKLEGTTNERLTPVPTPTGIEDLMQEATEFRGIYDLNGRLLPELRKGINIINGKKILKK